MAGGGRTAEKSAGETDGYCSSGREERESAREERETGFPEMETLDPLSLNSNPSWTVTLTSADHNFSIRSPILAYFVSTNSI